MGVLEPCVQGGIVAPRLPDASGTASTSHPNRTMTRTRTAVVPAAGLAALATPVAALRAETGDAP